MGVDSHDGHNRLASLRRRGGRRTVDASRLCGVYCEVVRAHVTGPDGAIETRQTAAAAGRRFDVRTSPAQMGPLKQDGFGFGRGSYVLVRTSPAQMGPLKQ